jgi:hypothetical protein
LQSLFQGERKSKFEAKQSVTLYVLHKIQEALYNFLCKILVLNKPNEAISVWHDLNPSCPPIPTSIDSILYYPVMLGINSLRISPCDPPLQLKSAPAEVFLNEGIDMVIGANELPQGSSLHVKGALPPWVIRNMVGHIIRVYIYSIHKICIMSYIHIFYFYQEVPALEVERFPTNSMAYSIVYLSMEIDFMILKKHPKCAELVIPIPIQFFSPPLSLQRRIIVAGILNEAKISSLLDAGCGAGDFLHHCLSHDRDLHSSPIPALQFVSGCDINKVRLGKLSKELDISLSTTVRPDFQLKQAHLWSGSILSKTFLHEFKNSSPWYKYLC